MMANRGTLAIVFLLLAFNGCQNAPAPTLTYASLVTEIKAGNVRSAELASDAITVTLKNPPQAVPAATSQQFRVLIPPSQRELERLIDMLTEHEVEFSVRE
jgi:hypothetical protein